ncbi:MAG TPA: PAS domain-containing protein [Candidatus Limnocylindrales bacterium]|nr:PAS domain-containing protein [Candidatus Limnocylindrales bacterium]
MGVTLSAVEYQVLVEQAPIMIWRANTTAECDYFNDRWLLFRGRTMEQEIGNQWAEGVHADDLPSCLTTYLESFRKRETFEMYYRLKRADGAYRWIFDRGVPFYSEAGEFLGYIGSCIDVTQRVEAQKAADEAKERELENLRGLMRICSTCKRICNTVGDWEQVESYIAAHSAADFTHGLCPDCLKVQFAIAEAL